MSRLAFVVLLAVIVAAMGFNSPVRIGKVAARAVSSKLAMSPADVAVEASTTLAQFSQTLAAESDFGGYAGPAASLLLIGFLILSLSPPLAPKEA
eukprot:gene5717-7892_t